MPIINPKTVESEPINQGQGVSRKMLISPEVGPNFAMRQYRIEPGVYTPLVLGTNPSPAIMIVFLSLECDIERHFQ